MLSVGFNPSDVDKVCQTMTSQGINHTRLSNQQLREKFPMMDVPRGTEAFYEEEGGVLFADHAMTAFLVKKIFRYRAVCPGT